MHLFNTKLYIFFPFCLVCFIFYFSFTFDFALFVSFSRYMKLQLSFMECDGHHTGYFLPARPVNVTVNVIVNITLGRWFSLKGDYLGRYNHLCAYIYWLIRLNCVSVIWLHFLHLVVFGYYCYIYLLFIFLTIHLLVEILPFPRFFCRLLVGIVSSYQILIFTCNFSFKLQGYQEPLS